MAGEHACAVEGCEKLAKAGQLMCFPHWKSLPTKLQRDVNATWKRYRYEPDAYRAAREAAVLHFVGLREEQDLLL